MYTRLASTRFASDTMPGMLWFSFKRDPIYLGIPDRRQDTGYPETGETTIVATISILLDYP